MTAENEPFNGIPEIDKTSWLWRAFDYVRHRSQLPDPAIFWTVAATAGATLQDGLHIDWASKPIYPNMPLLIVGPSGIGKTGAMRASLPLFEGCLPYKAAEDSTAEAVTHDLATQGRTRLGNTSVIWSVPELADVFGQKDYQQGSIARLTRLFDNPRDVEISRRTSGRIRIQGTCVMSWIAGTTLEWLREHVDPAVTAGGFLPRLFICYIKEPPKYIPDPKPDFEQVKVLNTDALQVTRDVLFSPHPLVLPPEWGEVAERCHKDKVSHFDTPAGAFAARRPENILRIAMILSTFAQMRVDSRGLRVAETCAKWFEKQALTLNTDLHLRLAHRDLSRLTDYVKSTQCVQFTTLCKNLHIAAKDMVGLLQELRALGDIQWNGATGTSEIKWVG